LDTGDEAKLTNLSYSPGNVVWSPDSKHLAFTLFTPASEKPLFTGMPAKPAKAEWAPSGNYIEKMNYRFDGAGYAPSGFSQLYVLPAEGGTPRQLTFNPYPNNGDMVWNKASTHLYFSMNPSDNYAMEVMSSDIYQLDVKTAKVTQVTDMPGPESSPMLSPDGKYLAFRYVNDRKLSHQQSDIWVMKLANGDMQNITEKLDRQVGQVEWASDSDGLYISYQDHGEVKLSLFELDGDEESLNISLSGQSLGRPYTSG
ncbi:MAG: S9 family peptidase, partial [Aestuariibacter sp.]|nr:S9 family peptidase [Aestuariibacter sp.]